MSARGRHLYRAGAAPEERRDFEREYEKKGYSKKRADRIYGATVGKVRRERLARGTIRRRAPEGRRAKPHAAALILVVGVRTGPPSASGGRGSAAHAHSRGHHGGRCPSDCRRGITAHSHRSRRRR